MLRRKELTQFIIAHPDWTAKEVSEKLNIELSRVYKLCRNYDLEYRRVWSTKTERAYRLEFIRDHAHLSLFEMSTALGITSAAVFSIVRHHELKFFNKSEGKITGHKPEKTKDKHSKSFRYQSLESLLGARK